MDRRRVEMLRVRQEILDAAGALFARFGYAGTTFSLVAKAMGRPKSVIGYHLFPSKASLAEAVLAAESARWRETLAALERAGTPGGAERLLVVLLACARGIDRCPERAGAMRLMLDLPVLGIAPAEPVDRVGFARACLADELALDPADPGDAVALAADVLLEATFGVVLCHVTKQGAVPLDARLATLWTSILQESGVARAAEIVERVVATPLPDGIVAEIEERLSGDELAASR